MSANVNAAQMQPRSALMQTRISVITQKLERRVTDSGHVKNVYKL